MHISIEDAAQLLLEQHQVVAIPTETVYGLAAPLSNTVSIQKIFQIKNRPSNNPLIVHFANYEQAQPYLINEPPLFRELTGNFWPGSLTLISPCKLDLVPEIVRAGLTTMACRVPAHPLAQQLIQRVGPLVAPSANPSGSPSATRPEHVESDFGQNFPVINGGECQQGLESTILHFIDNKWAIARLGAITDIELEKVLGYKPIYLSSSTSTSKPICPGQMYRHYAPKCALRLFKGEPSEIMEYILGFAEKNYPKQAEVTYLGSLHNPFQIAHNLYHVLRMLDQRGIKEIWVDMNIPKGKLWDTLRERIKKASIK